MPVNLARMLYKPSPIYTGYQWTGSKQKECKPLKYDFIPLIKCMPNICKWLGLGKSVRRNKRRV